MRIKNLSQTDGISTHCLLFFSGYTLCFISYFLGDLVQTEYDFSTISDLLKYGSYLLFAITAIHGSRRKREFVAVVLLMLIGLVVMVYCDVYYFCILFVMAFGITQIEERSIWQYSFWLLVGLLTVTFLLCLFGVLDNISTPRYVGDPVDRFALGFSHSNVPPLILFYLSCYWIMIHKGDIRIRQYVVMAVLHLVTYQICMSRNVIILSSVLLLGSLLIKKIRFGPYITRLVSAVTSVIPLFFVVFSTIATVKLNQYAIFQTVDRLLSSRISAAFRKMERLGLHLITSFDTDTFFSDGVVVDSAYSFMVIRYGLLVAVFVALLIFVYAYRERKDLYSTLVILVIATANFIDNDIFDYLCLPLMLIAIKTLISGWKEARLNT